MVVKIAEAAAPKECVPAFLPDDDNFFYGWRIVSETRPDGRTLYRELPLTSGDFLDPQIGDHFVQNSLHNWLVSMLFVILHNYYLNDPSTGVFCDLKMEWSIPGLKEPAPDLAVVPHIRHKEATRSSLDVIAEQTRPCLIVEVVSPRYPGDDTDKVAIYQQAGIAEYIIIDPHSDKEAAPFTLQGYRLAGGLYQKMRPDAEGRLLSKTTGIYFGLSESRRRVILTEAATGTRLLTPAEESTARRAAESQAHAAKAHAAKLEARLRQVEAELQRLKSNEHRE